MGKDPAFLFYPGDWLGGTQLFSRSEKGAYMDLLMAQFNNGPLTMNEIRSILGDDFVLMWDARLSKKFACNCDGLFYNERLEYEKVKRNNYVQSRNKNVAGNNQYVNTLGHMDGHMTSHMENRNRNKNRGLKGKKKGGTGGKGKGILYPDIEEVKKFFSDNGYSAAKGGEAWAYYSEAGWVDSRGNVVLNWKQKMRAVWFKPENRITLKEVTLCR